MVKSTGKTDSRGEEKEYKQRSQVYISTIHSFSINYFISDIATLPSSENKSVDCYCDEKHRFFSGQMESISYKENCVIDISKVSLPKNYQVTGKHVFIEETFGSLHASRPILVATEREKAKIMRHIVEHYIEPQLESLTHYSRNEVDDYTVIPSLPSKQDKFLEYLYTVLIQCYTI